MRFKIIFLITMLFIFNSVVFASEKDFRNLTVDEAVSKAISYSRELKELASDSETTNNNMETLITKLKTTDMTNEILNYALQIKQARYKLENNIKQSDIQKDNIRLSIINFFSLVLSAESEIKLYEIEINITEENLKIAETKKSLGLLSINEYNNEKLAYDKMLLNKKELENIVNEAYISLNKIMGTNLTSKYKLILNINYSEMEEIDLNSKIDMLISTSQLYKEKKETVEIAKYSYNIYSKATSNDTKLSKLNNYNESLRDLQDTEINLKEKLINTYNNIKKIESEYKSNIIELENLKKQLDILKLQYNVGKSKELDITKCEYNILKLQNQIQNQIYEHYLLKEKFNNPDLL